MNVLAPSTPPPPLLLWVTPFLDSRSYKSYFFWLFKFLMTLCSFNRRLLSLSKIVASRVYLSGDGLLLLLSNYYGFCYSLRWSWVVIGRAAGEIYSEWSKSHYELGPCVWIISGYYDSYCCCACCWNTLRPFNWDCSLLFSSAVYASENFICSGLAFASLIWYKRRWSPRLIGDWMSSFGRRLTGHCLKLDG